jgi:hypothetical protein
MKERPILFSAPMVRAILAGTKTQTRRVFKVEGQPITSADESIQQWEDGSFHYESANALSGPYACPYGQPGDQLWVRETFSKIEGQSRPWIETDYRATYNHGDRLGDHLSVGKGWKPAIHMPRAASRIDLEITRVRVERLKDISREDAEAEGAISWSMECPSRVGAGPTTAFRALWNSINGDGSWAANPWVWVVEFKRVKP